MTIIRLHLNGGPRDDTYIDHWTTALEIAAIRGGINTFFDAVEPSLSDSPVIRGRYVVRLDGNGEPGTS